MKTLIIGNGEVGKALYKVLSSCHEVYIRDIQDIDVSGIEVLHICYPDHEGFDKTTKNYILKYRPKVTIINSSVAVGTTDRCGFNSVYSPVRGRHPKLDSDLLIYKKFIFGRDKESVGLADLHFTLAGMETEQGTDPSTGEFLKLISNVHMGVEIAWRQEVQRMMTKFEIDSKTYDQWEESYSKGYFQSGDFNLIRPVMRPDPIGGHCILPCTDIISNQFSSKIFEFIKESNDKAKREVPSGTASVRT